MYSQLQVYGQQAATSTAAAPMIWNGWQWVPAPTADASSLVQQPPSAAGVIPPDPVATYTRYFHGWLKKATEWRQRMAASPQEQTLIQRQAEWFEYYRDNASRAAHYFMANPNATAAPDFDLPGDPDLWRPEQPFHTGGAVVVQQPQQMTDYSQQQQQHQPNNAPQQVSAILQQQQQQLPQPQLHSNPQDSFKRYFDRCMRQCTKPTQKVAMKKALEQKVTHHRTDGSFDSVQWDLEPSIPVLGSTTLNNADVTSSAAATFAAGHPIPSATTMSFSRDPRSQTMSIASADNPHGPAVSSSSSFPSTSHSYYGAAMPSTTIGPVSSTSGTDGYYGPQAVTTTLTASLASFSAPVSLDITKKQNAWSNKGKRKWSSTSSVQGDSGTVGDGGNFYYGPASAASSTTGSDSPSTSSPKKRPTSFNKKWIKGMPATATDGYYGPAATTTSASKKKKSPKNAGFNHSKGALTDRAKRFALHGGSNAAGVAASWTVDEDMDKYMGKGGVIGGKAELDEADYEQMKVKGTCQVLDKDYLRLTAPPRPELVRPLDILEQHMEKLKVERAKTSTKRDYLWFCSQLKAIRQDCTVQHIRNAFTVDVYETHARIALEEDDLNEYNQCQTQLKELYRLLQTQGNSQATANQCEFTAYRLLYYIFLSCNAKYSGGSSDLFQIMDSLSLQEREEDAVAHALRVRLAVADVDYHAFFCLHKSAPNLGSLLMDRISPTIRNQGLQRFFKAYRPSVEVDFVLKELGFDVESSEGFEFGRSWLESCGCLLSDDRKVWNTKDTVNVHESTLEENKSLI